MSLFFILGAKVEMEEIYRDLGFIKDSFFIWERCVKYLVYVGYGCRKIVESTIKGFLFRGVYDLAGRFIVYL